LITWFKPSSNELTALGGWEGWEESARTLGSNFSDFVCRSIFVLPDLTPIVSGLTPIFQYLEPSYGPVTDLAYRCHNRGTPVWLAVTFNGVVEIKIMPRGKLETQIEFTCNKHHAYCPTDDAAQGLLEFLDRVVV